MEAKKSLGQHFLRSERALATIIETANLDDQETALEIGPGEGVLTEKLLQKSGKVIAVEKDDELFEKLKEKFESEKKLELIHGDILNLEIAKLEIGNYKLIANIPYNITGAIFKKFLESDLQPEKMVLLVQKEVAERIVARDGKESILSISVKVYGNPRFIETVKAGSFAPMPKVDSAIISIENISKNFFTDLIEENFFEMLRAGFKSKRKKLSSNLSTIFDRTRVLETFERLNINPNVRAEELGVETWQKLAKSLL